MITKKLYLLVLTCLPFTHLPAMQKVTHLGTLEANGPVAWHKTHPDYLMISSKNALNIFDMSIDKGQGTWINRKALVYSLEGAHFGAHSWHTQDPRKIVTTSPDHQSICIQTLNKIDKHKKIFTGWKNTCFCSVAWHPTKQSVIAFGLGNGDIEIWDIEEEPLAFIYKAHDTSITLLAWQDTPPFRLASADARGNIKIWNTDHSDQTTNLMAHELKNEKDYDFLEINAITWHRKENRLSYIATHTVTKGAKTAKISHAHNHNVDSNDEFILPLAYNPYQPTYKLNASENFAYISPNKNMINTTLSTNISIKHDPDHRDHGYGVKNPFYPAFDWNPKYPELFAYSTEDKVLRIINVHDSEKILFQYSGYDMHTGIAMIAWNADGDNLAVTALSGETMITDVYKVNTKILLSDIIS